MNSMRIATNLGGLSCHIIISRSWMIIPAWMSGFGGVRHYVITAEPITSLTCSAGYMVGGCVCMLLSIWMMVSGIAMRLILESFISSLHIFDWCVCTVGRWCPLVIVVGVRCEQD